MLDANVSLAKYKAESGNEINLTPGLIRNVISTDPNVTDKEVQLFAKMCAAYNLDPFIKEAHLIKYGNNPATMVVGKDVFTKRAKRNPGFRGMNAGIIVDNGETVSNRKGSFSLPGEKIVGGWAEVYIKDYEVPFYDSVSFDEYAGRKKDGSLNKTWSEKPGTMIRKVALVHALREAFPEEFSGLYDSIEMGVEEQAEEPVQVEVLKSETLQQRGEEIIQEYAAGLRDDDRYYEEEVSF